MWEEHLEHLTTVFKVLLEKCFVVNKKYAIGGKQVEYLGHIISDQGVVVDPAKVKLYWNGLFLKMLRE